jgi:phosphatidylethanolamine-binding protein (PEBP) family uncharacterized protein
MVLFASNGISKEATKMDGLKVSSSAFEHNSFIPEKYTCDGKDVNPSLLMENIPSKPGRSPDCRDPDAWGTWVHCAGTSA